MKVRQKNHGYSNSKLYNCWRAMKQRCYDPSQYTDYYQGRGITVCDEWIRFSPFKEWALSSGYKEGLVIERIDPYQNYCPENCEWITRSENTVRRNAQYDYSTRKDKRARFIETKDCGLLSVSEYCEKRKIVYNTFRKGLTNLPRIIKEKDL